MIDRTPDRPMPPQTPQRSNPGDTWQPCPEGLFVDTAREERARLSRRRMLRTAGTAATALVTAGAGGLIWRLSTGSPAGELVQESPAPEAPITCQECLKLLPELLHDHVALATRARMEQHFAKCRHCRDEWAKLKQGHA